MAPSRGVSRRKETPPVEIDSTAVLVGLKQPLFTAPARSSSGSWRTAFGLGCIAALCVILGFSLASVLYERHLQQCEVPVQRIARRGKPAVVQSLAEILKHEKLPEELLQHHDVAPCEGIWEPEAVEPVPEKIKFLMIIGQGPVIWCRGERNIGNYTFLSKEPQFFNRWPLERTDHYLHAWHSGVIGEMISGSAGDRILLDASPQYLATAAAPARVQATVPHARFLVVDPVMRAFSDYVMMSRLRRPELNPSRRVPKPTFLEQVQSELHNGHRRPECFFNTTRRNDEARSFKRGFCRGFYKYSLLMSTPTETFPGWYSNIQGLLGANASEQTTWHDCFKCGFSYIDVHQERIQAQCKLHWNPNPTAFRNCNTSHYGFLDDGLYAPQLAWWLQFFPPDHFMIVSATDLRDSEKQIQVLNQIREHAGIPHSERFTQELVNGTHGFDGNYASRGFSENDLEAFRLVREFYRKPMEDLKALVATVNPHQNFTVVEESW